MCFSCFFDRLSVWPFISELAFGLFFASAFAGVFAGGLWAITAILGGVFLFFMYGLSFRSFLWPDQKLAFFLLVFLGFMGLTSLYSIEASLSVHLTLKMASILLPLLFLLSPTLVRQCTLTPRHYFLLAAALGLGFVFLDGVFAGFLLEGSQDVPVLLAKQNRGLSYGVLFAIPLLAALFRYSYRRAAFILLGLIVFSLFLGHSRATQTGVILAAFIFVLARYWPRVAALFLSLGVLLSSLWPFVAIKISADYPDIVAKLPDSWHARVEIWDVAAQHIILNPIWGYGAGAASKLDLIGPRMGSYAFLHAPAAHPHNAVLQLWSEMGLLGLMMGVGFVFWLLWRGLNGSNYLRPFIFSSIVLAYWLSLVAYSLWTDSLWGLFALTAFLFMLLKRHEIKASLSEPGA